MDSSPITHGAAKSFLGKKESSTDIDRAVVDAEGVVTAAAMFLRSAAEEAVEEKALAVLEPRVVDAKSSKE